MLDTDKRVPFSFFVAMCREISGAAVHKKAPDGSDSPALAVLKRWIRELRKEYSPLPPGTSAIIFRLLFPEEDKRRVYNMRETLLARRLSDLLCLTDGRLQSWNNSSSSGCLGQEVYDAIERTWTNADNGISPLYIDEVDNLLDELASHAPHSHTSIHARFPPEIRRNIKSLLHSLYYTLSPIDASYITQIILKDIRPLLYPPQATHYTAALLKFNAASITILTKEDAMKAWDPTFLMIKAYRVRSTLDQAAASFELGAQPLPVLGVPIEIPKCEKGKGCSHALSFMNNAEEAWAEIKYDGERAQIHVEIMADNTSRITIFSKSKRDSTLDRFGVHHIIKRTLSLPDSHHQSRPSQVKRNIILDAEMVAFNGTEIDEFWRLRTLIRTTAVGARAAAWKPAQDSQESSWSQCSLISEVSEDRHLGLVFYDVLFLDSKSLLSTPYARRREFLESLIEPIPGESMLAERFCVDLRHGLDLAIPRLIKIYARIIADHQEGLVLKAADSRYNEWGKKWVKMKKDYIPGYGDNLDLVVVGASWNPERARKLFVGPDTLTTFYIGSLKNADAVKRNPKIRPHFYVYFTAEWGLPRQAIEELNFLIKNSRPLSGDASDTSLAELAYTFRMSGLKRPTFILREPLIAEVFGGGFTKEANAKYYHLRFPRITKVYRSCERSWKECVDLKTLSKIAHESIGRDPANKEANDWASGLWGKPVSPSVKAPQKRRAAIADWEGKFMAVEPRNVRQRINLSDSPLSSYWKKSSSRIESARRELNPLRPMTNFVDLLQASQSQEDVIIAQSVKLAPQGPSGAQLPISPPISPEKLPSGVVPNTVTVVESPEFDEHELVQFFSESVVWFARPAAGSHLPSPSWKKCVPHQQRIHAIESLLTGCGWHTNEHRSNLWMQRGLIFIDLADEDGKTWEKYVLRLIEERQEVMLDGGSRRPLMIFDLRKFMPGMEDREKQAIHSLR